MTEKEKFVEEKLMNLVLDDEGDKIIKINFESDSLIRTRASKYDDIVVMTLVNPGSDESKLDEWLTAIDDAEKMKEQVHDEMTYAQSSTIFFTSIIAKVRPYNVIISSQ